jgi:hypothetical protein
MTDTPTHTPLFARSGTAPRENELKRSLAGVYSAYEELLDVAAAYNREWKFYGPKIGWQLKISRKGKALCYLTPLDGSFRLGMAVREAERTTLLASRLPAALKTELRTAKKYTEGYPLRIHVTGISSMKTAKSVLHILITARQ